MRDHRSGHADRLARPRIGRRQLIAGAGLLGLSTGVAACAGPRGPVASPPPPAATAPAPAPTVEPTVLAKTADIPVGGGAVFPANRVVVTQPGAGDFRAFSAICTHEGCTVNKVAGGTINCPCHGSRFSIVDGSVVAGPAARPLHPRSIAVREGGIALNQ